MGQLYSFENLHPPAEDRDRSDEPCGMDTAATDWSDPALSSRRLGKHQAIQREKRAVYWLFLAQSSLLRSPLLALSKHRCDDKPAF